MASEENVSLTQEEKELLLLAQVSYRVRGAHGSRRVEEVSVESANGVTTISVTKCLNGANSNTREYIPRRVFLDLWRVLKEANLTSKIEEDLRPRGSPLFYHTLVWSSSACHGRRAWVGKTSEVPMNVDGVMRLILDQEERTGTGNLNQGTGNQ
jgi:hypothetical protein